MDPRDPTVWGNVGDGYSFSATRKVRAADAYAKAIELAAERLTVNRRDPEVRDELLDPDIIIDR